MCACPLECPTAASRLDASTPTGQGGLHVVTSFTTTVVFHDISQLRRLILVYVVRAMEQESPDWKRRAGILVNKMKRHYCSSTLCVSRTYRSCTAVVRWSYVVDVPRTFQAWDHRFVPTLAIGAWCLTHPLRVGTGALRSAIYNHDCPRLEETGALAGAAEKGALC